MSIFLLIIIDLIMAFTPLDFTLIVGTILTLYTSFIFLVVIFGKGRSFERTPRLPAKLPSVSVIVPAYNEEKTIAQTLNSLLSLDYPKKLLQIIAVNDGSEDGTLSIMKKFVSRGVEVLNKKNEGKPSALNAGLKVANGDVLVCLDADSAPEPDVLKKTLGYFENPKIGAVTTSLKVAESRTFTQKVQWIEYIMNIIYRKAFAMLNAMFVIPGPFSLYRRSTLEKIGGFEEGNITEDMEIGLRMQSNGYMIENSVYAYTHTHSPPTWKKLFMQRVRWYRGFIINSRRYKHLYFNKNFGNLGLFTLPANFAFVIFSFVFIGALTYQFADQLFNAVTLFLKIGFVMPEITVPNLILESSLFHVLWFLSTFILFTMLYAGLKLGREKFSWKLVPAFFAGIFIYVYFITATWAVAFYRELRGAELKWER